ESSQGFGADEDQPQEDSDLNNSSTCHIFLRGRGLKLLRSKQCVNQIKKQRHRRDSGDDVIHKFSLKPVAGLGKCPAGKQEQAPYGYIEQVKHWSLTPFPGKSLRALLFASYAPNVSQRSATSVWRRPIPLTSEGEVPLTKWLTGPGTNIDAR